MLMDRTIAKHAHYSFMVWSGALIKLDWSKTE